MSDSFSAGHRSRLRQRFDRLGLQGFLEYEILELLLTYVCPRKDTKPMAKALLACHGSLAAVLLASDRELRQCVGMGEQSARFLRLMPALLEAFLLSDMPQRDLLQSPERVREHLRLRLQGQGYECFGVIFLNQQLGHLATEILFEGTIDRTAVYPRMILKRALELDARGMMVFHNHPAGTAMASEQDKQLTRLLQQACKPLEIRFLDHWLIAGTQVLSFMEEGWMESLC